MFFHIPRFPAALCNIGTVATLLMLLCSGKAVSHPDSLLVVSWNIENFFDCTDEGGGDSDRAHTPEGERHWTTGRFYAKCQGIAKTLLLIAERYGRLPDAVALQEVENRRVLQRLLEATPLRKIGYGIAHVDSPDRRGIDCALLYRKSTLPLVRTRARHLYDSTGHIIPTRDILLAEFPGFDILVNHHPSRIGNGSGYRRTVARQNLQHLLDSLETAGHPHLLAVGDFTDALWGDSGNGTIKDHGRWEKIDGHFQRGIANVREETFADACLSEEDRSFGGLKPHRTYIGPRYRGGISDHYPIVLVVVL